MLYTISQKQKNVDSVVAQIILLYLICILEKKETTCQLIGKFSNRITLIDKGNSCQIILLCYIAAPTYTANRGTRQQFCL